MEGVVVTQLYHKLFGGALSRFFLSLRVHDLHILPCHMRRLALKGSQSDCMEELALQAKPRVPSFLRVLLFSQGLAARAILLELSTMSVPASSMFH